MSRRFFMPTKSQSDMHHVAVSGLLSLVCALPCFARWTSLDVPPLGSTPDTEAVTNVVFDAGGEDVRLFRLVVELSATESNSVDR